MCLLSMLCCPLQLALGQQGAVLTKVEEISLPTTPMDMRDAFWRKIRKLFWENFFSHYPLEVKSRFGRKLLRFSPFTSHRTREVRLVPDFWIFLPSALLWRWAVRFDGGKSYFYMKFLQPSLTWEKCQPPLFYYPLEGKRLLERKKDAVIQIFFSLIYLDRKRLIGRKNLKIEKKQPSHRKGFCEMTAWCWKIHDCVI